MLRFARGSLRERFPKQLISTTIDPGNWRCTPRLNCCEYPVRRLFSKKVTAVVAFWPTGTAPNASFSAVACGVTFGTPFLKKNGAVMPLSGLFRLKDWLNPSATVLGTPASKGCAKHT